LTLYRQFGLAVQQKLKDRKRDDAALKSVKIQRSFGSRNVNKGKHKQTDSRFWAGQWRSRDKIAGFHPAREVFEKIKLRVGEQDP
jgi:hypothetical protein